MTSIVTASQIGNMMIEAERRRLDCFESEVLISLTMSAAMDTPLPDAEIPLTIQIFKKRMEVHRIPVDEYLPIMIGVLCDRPGTVVLYCAVMKALHEKNGGQLTIARFVDAFPTGVPTEKELERIWEVQKVHDGKGPDNWLDRAEAWKTPETVS